MEIATLVFAVLAFAASAVGIYFAWRQHRDGDRERHVEIVEIVGELNQNARFGHSASIGAATAQQRLRAKLVGIADLPIVEELAAMTLAQDPDKTIEWAGRALAEAQAALRDLLRPRVRPGRGVCLSRFLSRAVSSSACLLE